MGVLFDPQVCLLFLPYHHVHVGDEGGMMIRAPVAIPSHIFRNCPGWDVTRKAEGDRHRMLSTKRAQQQVHFWDVPRSAVPRLRSTIRCLHFVYALAISTRIADGRSLPLRRQ